MRGDDSDITEVVLTGSGPDVVRQVAFLKAATVDKTQLIDDVQAAEYATHTHLATLETARTTAKSLQTKLTDEKAAATQAIGQQQALQATVTGELAQLVAQAQAAQAALAEQQAKARLVAAPAPSPAAGGSHTTTPAAPGHPAPGHPQPAPSAAPDGPPATADPGPIVPLPVPNGSPPPVLGAAARAISVARQFIGTAYAWGGASPATGFDCSGLVQYSFAQAGVSLPRVADQQAAATRHISYAQATAGDLVFFDSPDVGHVGIYLGGGMMLDAPHTGAFVRIEPIWRTPSWASAA